MKGPIHCFASDLLAGKLAMVTGGGAGIGRSIKTWHSMPTRLLEDFKTEHRDASGSCFGHVVCELLRQRRLSHN